MEFKTVKRPSLSNEQEDKKQECIHKLDLMQYRLCIRFKGCYDVHGNITDIVDHAKNMLRWVHEYDCKPTLPANGYRSLIRLAINMMKAGLSVDDQNVHEYCKLVKIFKEAIRLIQDLRYEQIEQQKISGSEAPVFHSTPVNMTVELMTKFTDNVELFGIIFGPLEGFDKRPIVKYLTKVAHYLMAIRTSPSWTGMVSALVSVSPDLVTKVTAQRYISHNVAQVASMLAGGRGFLYETLLNHACNFASYPNVMETIHVPRQCKWIIDADFKRQHIAIKYNNNSSSKGTVRCRMYQQLPEGERPNGSLVIFCHGGGFITNSPESHEMWMLRFVKSLPRATFISIDFKVSPEGKFPEALQQILDVILWSQSGGTDCEEILGFKPNGRNVIFCGDSSGSLLITTALIAMAEINETVDGMNIKMAENAMRNAKADRSTKSTNASDDDKLSRRLTRLILPKSLLTFYPTFCLSPRVFPSYFLSVFDPVLFPTIAVQMANAYLPPMSDKDGLVKWDADMESQAPWFRHPMDKIKAVFDNNLPVFEHPLVSPLLYQKMDTLKEVNLYIIALHPDPLLDNAIMMASKWEGAVSIDVLDDLAHGFLNYIFFNFMKSYREKFNPAIDLCIHRMRQALYD